MVGQSLTDEELNRDDSDNVSVHELLVYKCEAKEVRKLAFMNWIIAYKSMYLKV